MPSRPCFRMNAFCASENCADCIISMSGFELRQAHLNSEPRTRPRPGRDGLTLTQISAPQHARPEQRRRCYGDGISTDECLAFHVNQKIDLTSSSSVRLR